MFFFSPTLARSQIVARNSVTKDTSTNTSKNTENWKVVRKKNPRKIPTKEFMTYSGHFHVKFARNVSMETINTNNTNSLILITVRFLVPSRIVDDPSSGNHILRNMRWFTAGQR